MYIFRLFDKNDDSSAIDARMLGSGVMRIGRDPGCEWVVSDPNCEISRTHVEFRVADKGLLLRCLGRNGVVDCEDGTRFPEDIDIAIDTPHAIAFGAFRLVAERAPDIEFSPGGESRTQLSTPPLGESSRVPSDWADPSAQDHDRVDGSLLEAFCRGAGLDSSMLTSEEPAEIMRRAGALYRQMVLGVGDLMAEREAVRARFRLTHTTIGGNNNNPFKWAPTQRLAIDLLLAGDKGFLSGPAALKASFEDIKKHLISTFSGFRAAIRVAIDNFDPAETQKLAGTRRHFLKGAATAQLDIVAERHAELDRQWETDEDGPLNEAFVKAYDAASTELNRDSHAFP